MKLTNACSPDYEDFLEAMKMLKEGVPPGPCDCIHRIENWIRCSECPYMQQLWNTNRQAFLEKITRTSEK